MKKLVWVFLLVSSVAHASEINLEQYIEVASLTKKAQSKVGKSVEVVDSSIFEEYKPLMLTDVIHNVPGVYVKRINGMSGLTNVRIRGARSIDTKLLYNGIPLQDPSDPQGSANPLWGDLAASGVERVEVLKGASSTVWGSEAIGGVINTVPKKGCCVDGIRVTGEVGSNESYTERIEARIPGLYAGVSRLDSDGFDHHDDYHNSSFNFNYLFSPSDKFSMEFQGLYSQTEARLNESPVILGGVLMPDVDDPNDRREYELLHGGITTDIQITDSVVFRNKVGSTESDRRFVFLPDSEFDFYSDGIFRGNDFILQDQVAFTHNKNLTTVVGHQYERQWYELDQKDLRESDQADAYSNDYYIEENIDIYNLHVILAGRNNTHERAKSRTTFDASANYRIESLSTILRSHFGSSYRTPSLYELYGAFLTSFGRFEIGNDKLSPERGQSFDVGFTSNISDNIDIGATFFHNSVRNKIDFFGFSYSNREGVDSNRGVELFYEQYLADGLSFRTSYTYTEGDNLVDVPESLWDASLRYAKGKWVGNVRTRYVSDHRILAFNLDDFTVGNINEEGHFTVDATIAYKIKPNIEIYVRAENLLSEDYHEGGYRTPGARVYGGITWKC